MSESKKTKVTLWSWTQHPIETIYCEWQASRTNGPVPTPAGVAEKIRAEGAKLAMYENPSGTTVSPSDVRGPFQTEVEKVFADVVDMKIPVAETIDFVFLIENCPITLREQMVRHRIGHRWGMQLGVDIIPEVAESTWWSQTSRVKDMGSFAEDGDYFLPASVSGKKGVQELYTNTMQLLGSAYQEMVKAGIPIEDARNVLPVAAQSRLTWKANLSAIMHVLSKRSCWIAELGIWEPVVLGMVEELCTKVHPYFRKLINPPCIGKDDKFAGCVFDKENANRLPGGIDPYPPCSLWVNNDRQQQVWGGTDVTTEELEGAEVASVGESRMADYTRRKAKYAQLWGRDPETGERKQLA